MDEEEFQNWYKAWAAKARIDPDPDNPLHFYDYRAAYRAGAEPTMSAEDGRLHWPSEFKADNHPNRYVMDQGHLLDTKAGKPVDPTLEIALRKLSQYGQQGAGWLRSKMGISDGR